VLVAGGLYVAGTTAELYDEGRGASPSWTPTLSGPIAAVMPGTAIDLTGTLFTGVSEGSSGNSQSSPANCPLVFLSREDNEAQAWAPVTAFSATSLTATLPGDLAPGWFWARVVVNGVPSAAQPLLIARLARGSACGLDSQCGSGLCVDGVCCDAACGDGTANDCQACSVLAGAAVDGTCGPVSGTACDDGDACTQTDTCQTGTCTGSNPLVCASPDSCHAAGTCDPTTGICSNPEKSDGTSCPGGTCLAGVCVPEPPDASVADLDAAVNATDAAAAGPDAATVGASDAAAPGSDAAMVLASDAATAAADATTVAHDATAARPDSAPAVADASAAERDAGGQADARGLTVTQGCGCASTGFGPSEAGLLLLGFISLRRRRRR